MNVGQTRSFSEVARKLSRALPPQLWAKTALVTVMVLTLVLVSTNAWATIVQTFVAASAPQDALTSGSGVMRDQQIQIAVSQVDASDKSGGEEINLELRNHQSSVGTWNFQAAAADLHQWAERMILRFKLEIGTPALLIQPLKRRYGHFKPERNGFGLIDEIGIDETHVRRSPYWRVCGTLLHELLHSWQKQHGKSSCRNYHNNQFRQKALSLGLKIDVRGFTEYIPGDTPFFNLLKEHGIVPPDIPNPQEHLVSRVGSKLKLYECPCGVKVRVGRSRFNARCLDCEGVFVLTGTNNKK